MDAQLDALQEDTQIPQSSKGLTARLVELEHGLEQKVAADVEHTIDDMRKLETRLSQFEKQHPRIFVSMETVVLLGLLVALLIGQLLFFR